MDSQAARMLQKKRTSNFREDETKLLIQLWGSPQVQNKLYLTHRKAPVMRILASNMQQRGFYRTPDEIKTRIRNLKCLYHRIKRTMQSGAGLGTVDPDWPHFKAMDAILSKQGLKKENLYKDNIFEGPSCEDIKQEIDDIDINDDMESYTTSIGGSDFEEETTAPPPLTPAPTVVNKCLTEAKASNVQQTLSIKQKIPQMILPNLTVPLQNHNNSSTAKPGTVNSLPFPLLILNGVQSQNAQNLLEKNANNPASSDKNVEKQCSSEIENSLKQLVQIQQEKLEIEKEKLELEKQKVEFERVISTQLHNLVPMLTDILQKITSSNVISQSANNDKQLTSKNRRKRPCSDIDILKDSKILRTVLEQGIKKYMLGEDIEIDDSDTEESVTKEEKTKNINNNSLR